MAGHWKIAAALAAAIALLAWIVAAAQPERYRATAIAAVAPVSENLTPADMMRGVDTLERRVVVSSVAALASAPVTHRQTRAGDDYTLTALVLPNTNLFRIEVEGPDARKAAAIANQVPAIVGRQARTIYRIYDVTLVSEAGVPRRPASPRAGRALLAGLALGLLLGVAAAWFLDGRRLASGP